MTIRKSAAKKADIGAVRHHRVMGRFIRLTSLPVSYVLEQGETSRPVHLLGEQTNWQESEDANGLFRRIRA